MEENDLIIKLGQLVHYHENLQTMLQSMFDKFKTDLIEELMNRGMVLAVPAEEQGGE